MESTREILAAMMAGTLDLNEITMAEYLQITFIHAMNNGIIHIDQPVMYGGQLYSVHMCMNKVGPSASLDDALAGTQ